ncbi:hypothetical protein MESS4_330007 [Mesorhizobium sp. STM 4661]|nr:hypothetical protein MESS4_330007 [Mesorhizobium sp. STM 4661]
MPEPSAAGVAQSSTVRAIGQQATHICENLARLDFERFSYVEELNDVHATFTALILFATKDCGPRSASATLAWVKPLFLRAAISCSSSRRSRGDRKIAGIRRCLSLFRSRIEQRCRFNLQHRSELLDHVDGSRIYTALKSADVGSINTSFMCQRLLRQLLFLAKPTQIAGKDLSDSHTREATLLLRISPRSILYKLKEQLARASTLPELPAVRDRDFADAIWR